MPVIDLRENKGNMTIPGIVPKPHVEDDSIKYKNIRQLPSSNNDQAKIASNHNHTNTHTKILNNDFIIQLFEFILKFWIFSISFNVWFILFLSN